MRVARSLLLVLFFVLLSPAPSATETCAGATDEETALAVSRVLLDRDYLPPERDEEAVVRRLVGLGTDAVPELFGILRSRSVPLRTASGDLLYKRLERWHEAVLRAALERAPAAALRELFGALGEEADVPSRALALSVLAVTATRTDLELLASLAAPPRQRARAPRELRAAFEDALVRWVEREPRVVVQLAELYQIVHPSQVTAIVRCLGRSPSEDRFRTLGALLGDLPEADPLILVELARVGAGLPHPLDDGVKARVRRYLSEPDAARLSGAIDTVERLGDDGAVPRLVALLVADDGNVRAQALRALRAITHQRIGLDPVAWDRWLAGEHAWLRGESARLIADVQSGDVEAAARAALEIARHRLYRDGLTPVLLACLEREDEEIVRIACAGLGHFESERATPRLIALLDDERRGVRQEAWRALQRISGESLPPDSARWLAAFAGRPGFPNQGD